MANAEFALGEQILNVAQAQVWNRKYNQTACTMLSGDFPARRENAHRSRFDGDVLHWVSRLGHL